MKTEFARASSVPKLSERVIPSPRRGIYYLRTTATDGEIPHASASE
jgi:hypothetical protein